MQMIYRTLISIIAIMVVIIVLLDFFGYHGTILLDKVANGALINAMDSFWDLFEGPDAFTNFMYVAVVCIGLVVGVIALFFTFIKE